jgi:molecular chaperone GrpE
MSKTKTSPPSDEVQNQIKTLDENWKRALADYQNLLRRVEQDKKEFLRLANTSLIAGLIPSLEIMEKAATHSQDPGVVMAAKQFHDALAQEGVVTIEPAVGDVFNPEIHNCIDRVTGTETSMPETIAELVSKGYKLYDHIIYPAKVKVFQNG